MGETKEPEGDFLSPPSWIDIALIQKALRNGGDENSQVAAISISRGSAAGDNYGSSIYRVKATLSDGAERSFIVKGLPPGARMSNFASESGIFRREAILLEEIIPQMQALLEEAAPGRFQPLAPRCYLHGTHPVEFLVTEDLAPGGFRLGERKRGLGLRHCLLALRNLARFHASSHALLQRQPGLVQRLDNIWRAANQGFGTFIDRGLQAAAKACLSWPGFEEYGERIEKFKVVATDVFDELNDAKPGAFNVVLHGDFWVNNMMFNYEDGVPKEHRSFDLQLSRVASPAIDVLYFLAASVSDDVQIYHQDLLLREYHFALKDTMEILGFQAPSLESLLAAMDVHGAFSLFIALCGVPIVKTEGATDVNAVFSGDDSVMTPLFEYPDVKRWMQRVIPDYARKGWLPA